MHSARPQVRQCAARVFLLVCTALSVAFLGNGFFAARAQEFSSDDFTVLDPVMYSAGYSTSTGFGLWGTIEQMGIGTSSQGSFEVRSGFEYYPFVTTPVVSAALQGNNDVDLSWTAAQGYLGWTVSGYEVGVGTVSGGPYSSTPVGLVLADTVTGLSANTTYYFVVVVQDAFGNDIGTSTEISVLTGTGGGDDDDDDDQGGQSGTRGGQVSVTGYGHPDGRVYILRNGVLTHDAPVGSDGTFTLLLSAVPIGSYTLTLYGIDDDGVRSSLLAAPVSISSAGFAVTLGGIFLPPTILFEEDNDPNRVIVAGATVPNASVAVVSEKGEGETFVRSVTSDRSGRYELSISKDFLREEGRIVKASASAFGARSPFSFALNFGDGEYTISYKGDFNEDGRIDLIDFSMLAYWYHRVGAPARFDLNDDGDVTIVDFSILAYYWTG